VRYFETRFLEEADKFVAKLERKSARKIFYNIDLAEQTNDPKLFKKLQGEIWEFRSQYLGNQNRLLAFWDKIEPTETLVLATHGFIKKDNKVPISEIERAERIREAYFKNKNLKK
jgi:phage-related protein